MEVIERIMHEGKNLVNIPKALFEDSDVSVIRGQYIMKYINGEGKKVPSELLRQYGYFEIPGSIFVEVKRKNLFLADLTFLFACYYVAATNERKSIRMDEVYHWITKSWDDSRSQRAAENLMFTLYNIDMYKRWIKVQEHNNKYYVNY